MFILDLLLIDQPQSPQTVDVGEGQLARGLAKISPPREPEFLAGGVVEDMSDSLDRLRMSPKLRLEFGKAIFQREQWSKFLAGLREDRHGLFKILG